MDEDINKSLSELQKEAYEKGKKAQKQEDIVKFLKSVDRIENASIRQTVNNNLDILGDTIQEEREKWRTI